MSLAAFGRLTARVQHVPRTPGCSSTSRPRSIAEIIWGTIHGHVMLELIGMSATLADPAERYERTLQLLFEGFGVGDRATGPLSGPAGAERAGFEPARTFLGPYSLSRGAPSTGLGHRSVRPTTW